MEQISVDFYVPANYENIEITWYTESPFLEVSDTSEIIEVRLTLDTTLPIEVYQVKILGQPNIL